jgi:Zn-dependent M28 family amino/carboxypeptidase
MIVRFMACLLFLLLPHLVRAQDVANNPAKDWWKHVEFLANDQLAGRETGSDGYRKAAEYVAGAFTLAGLKPGGTSGYFQPVRFISRQIVEEQCSLSIVRSGEEHRIVLGEEAFFSMGIEHPPRVEAPLVFAGYGLKVPEMNYDDLAGLELRGKVVILLSGGPSNIPGPLRAHYQSTRWKELRRAGAIGVISIQNPIGQDIPWDRSKLARFRPSLTLADSSLEENSAQQLAVTINPAYAEKFFTESGHTFQEILRQAEAGGQLPRFNLPASVRATVKFVSKDIESQNVVGILPGTDPRVKDEYVAITAHLDHLGEGEPINNDPIYNGAMDNASGIATLIETARALQQKNQRLKRSVIFLAVTAEENGLRGSKYFAANPTVPDRKIVANVNVDMFLPLYPLRSLIVQGLDESNLAEDLRRVGEKFGIKILSDPEPERRAFVRSDQYSFIRRGVPAVSLKNGFIKDSPEHEIVKRWRKERYHAPSDDLNQPFDLQAAADFNHAFLLVVESIANRSKRPQWNKDSFFRRFAR